MPSGLDIDSQFGRIRIGHEKAHFKLFQKSSMAKILNTAIKLLHLGNIATDEKALLATRVPASRDRFDERGVTLSEYIVCGKCDRNYVGQGLKSHLLQIALEILLECSFSIL